MNKGRPSRKNRREEKVPKVAQKGIRSGKSKNMTSRVFPCPTLGKKSMMMTLPAKQYYASLPKKRIAAGIVWFDEAYRLLIGRPKINTAEAGKWSIPGGVVEADESPQAGAIRESEEEIGLHYQTPRILAVHYLKAVGDKTESLQFYFLGGLLSAADTRLLELPKGSEWEEFRLASREEAKTLLSSDLSVCVDDWISAAQTGLTLYIETQCSKKLTSKH